MDLFTMLWTYFQMWFWFAWYKVVKDVIPEPPMSRLYVSWENASAIANLGNLVTPTQMKDQPIVKWNSDVDSYYTLMMVDPDEPTLKNILHWLVVNVPRDNVGKGETKAEYVGSAAPKDSGLHRYTTLAFRQTKLQFFNISYIDENTANTRVLFNVTAFVEKYSLKLEAGNFVQAEWDEYVPILQQQLGIAK